MISYGQRPRDYFPTLLFVTVISIKNDSCCINKEKASHAVRFPEVPESTFSIFFLYQKFLAMTNIHATMKEPLSPKVKDTNAHVYKDSLGIMRNRLDEQCFILT